MDFEIIHVLNDRWMKIVSDTACLVTETSVLSVAYLALFSDFSTRPDAKEMTSTLSSLHHQRQPTPAIQCNSPSVHRCAALGFRHSPGRSSNFSAMII